MARLVTPSVPIEKSSIIQSQRNFNFSSQNLLPKIDGLNFTRAPRKIPLSISRETSEVPINSAPPKAANPIIVIDNYDSFTYNLCQVSFFFCLSLVEIELHISLPRLLTFLSPEFCSIWASWVVILRSTEMMSSQLMS